MEQTVTFSVDAALRDAFMHIAEKNDCNYAELLKDFMADYVCQDTRNQQYEDWSRCKVEAGLAQLNAGMGVSHEEANAQVEMHKSQLKSERHAELTL
jgi:predicted transcriptional regulator